MATLEVRRCCVLIRSTYDSLSLLYMTSLEVSELCVEGSDLQSRAIRLSDVLADILIEVSSSGSGIVDIAKKTGGDDAR